MKKTLMTLIKERCKEVFGGLPSDDGTIRSKIVKINTMAAIDYDKSRQLQWELTENAFKDGTIHDQIIDLKNTDKDPRVRERAYAICVGVSAIIEDPQGYPNLYK